MPILTVVAARAATTLDAPLLGLLRDAVRGAPPDILSPGEAADIACPAADATTLRPLLGDAPVDLFVTDGPGRRKRLLLADMDSTIVTTETLDEIAARAGIGAQVAAITRRSMNGEIDFSTALRERVAMLAGLDLGVLTEVWASTHLMPGARTLVATMRQHKAGAVLVSGGFTWFTGRVAAAVGFDTHVANRLLDDGTRLTGAVADPILDRDAKLATLRAEAARRGLRPEDTIAVGDGANDLAMIEAAGFGVAYHAKPIVSAAARWTVRHADLRALLFLQGYRAAEVVEASDHP